MMKHDVAGLPTKHQICLGRRLRLCRGFLLCECSLQPDQQVSKRDATEIELHCLWYSTRPYVQTACCLLATQQLLIKTTKTKKVDTKLPLYVFVAEPVMALEVLN